MIRKQIRQQLEHGMKHLSGNALHGKKDCYVMR